MNRKKIFLEIKQDLLVKRQKLSQENILMHKIFFIALFSFYVHKKLFLEVLQEHL